MTGVKCRKLKVSASDKVRVHNFDYHTDFTIKKGDRWCNVNHLFKKEIIDAGLYKPSSLKSQLSKYFRRGTIRVRLGEIPKKYLR